MSKTKSVVMTIILTVVIVVLSLMCVVPQFTLPFRVGGIWTQYNSVVSIISYGSDLGGGYSAVYYPEGVVSAETYNTQVEYYEEKLDADIRKYLNVAEDDPRTLDELRAVYEASEKTSKDVNETLYDMDEYVKKYVAYTGDNFPALKDAGVSEAAVYMEINEVCTADGKGSYELTASFTEEFEEAVGIMVKRFDDKNFSSLSVSVKDGCAIQVSVPYSVKDPDTLFEQMGYTGEFMLRANEEVTTRPLLKANGEHPISDYFKSASSIASGDTGVVRQLNLTTLGKDKVYELTDALRDNETDATLYFYVGDTQVIGLGLSDEKDGLDLRTLYISGSFTPETAENVGIVIDSCIKEGSIDMGFSVGQTVDYTVGTGAGATTAVYIVFAVAMLAMFIFFVVRYKGLGVTHMFAYLSYLICMLMFAAFLPGMLIGASGVFAVALTSVIMALTNYYIFENVRKEFDTGKTLTSAVKSGYKRSLAPVLDTHILLFLIALILFFTGIGEIVAFTYVFLFGILMSGISALLLTRYYWYIMRGLLARSRQHAFSGFKREVSDDDDEE